MHWRDRKRRRPAFNEPGHAHELTFCCFRRYPFLRADRTCRWLAEAITAARVDFDFALWAYVFMPDHVHLVVWPRRPVYDTRPILGAIKEPAGRRAIGHIRRHHPDWLPRLTVRKGQRTWARFWQPGGGYDRNVTEPNTLDEMIAYIHQNPVRKGLVERAEEWTWSSAGWYAGAEPNSLKPDPIPPDWGVVR